MQHVADINSLTGTRAGVHSSKVARRAGLALSAVVIGLLALDALGKLLRVEPVLAGSAELGYPPSTVFPIGLILLACVVIHAIPRTAVLGAVLLTGYLGGAIATHLRVGDPLLTHTLFPLYVAGLIWGGLFLRDGRLRAFLSWRTHDRQSHAAR